MGSIDSKVGFSSIELLAGLALMGIIAAIALPGWRSLLPTYALNHSTRQIQSEVHYLKMRAAAENIAFQLAFQPGSDHYIIYRDAQVVGAKPLAQGTSITKAGAITFSPRGTAGANRVRLSGANGQCRQIVVSATGRVRVCRPSNCSSDC